MSQVPINLKQFTDVQNAGDIFSSMVVAHICNDRVRSIGEAPFNGPNLIAAGSILHWADTNSVVWGTGLLWDDIELKAAPKVVLSVRGAYTWESLARRGITSPPLFGDPGVFAPDIFPKARTVNEVGIVPHYVDVSEELVLRAHDYGAEILDVRSPLDDFLRRLSACRKIISSSLHGLIFAHAYGIPAVWVKLSSKVIGDGYKFFDYYSSIGYARARVPVLSANDSIPTMLDYCDLPRCQIDKAALAATLRASSEFFTV
jgi:hypothetical protein